MLPVFVQDNRLLSFQEMCGDEPESKQMPFHTPVGQMCYSCVHTAAAEPIVSAMGQLIQ